MIAYLSPGGEAEEHWSAGQLSSTWPCDLISFHSMYHCFHSFALALAETDIKQHTAATSKNIRKSQIELAKNEPENEQDDVQPFITPVLCAVEAKTKYELFEYEPFIYIYNPITWSLSGLLLCT